MSRNSEKAQSMLFKWRAQQAASQGVTDLSGRRPRNIMACDSVAACEKWRNQVYKEITHKVNKINDASLTDFQVRDLNDEINKLQKEKHVWEVQLRNIGGTNYIRFQGNATDTAGRVIGSHKGYKYYGRAKELPGIKELFSELAAPPVQKKSRSELLKLELDAGYYGYYDDQNSDLLEYEKARETQARNNLAGGEQSSASRLGSYCFPTLAEVPSRADIEAMILQTRKSALLAKYA